jgi:hypothetical protein
VIRATGAQRNPGRTVDPEVSYRDDRIRTYLKDHYDKSDRERPHYGQNPQLQYRVDWASTPAKERSQDPRNSRDKSDRDRPHDGQNPKRQYKTEWASKPANRRNRRVCKVEKAYKPADAKKNEIEKVIGPAGRDLKEETKPATESVSSDHGIGGNLPKEKAPWYQNRDGGGPCEGQKLRGELKTHRAREPDGGFEKKRRTGKKNKKETYLERCETEIPGGGPDEGREPRSEPRVDWARRPTSEGIKTREKSNRKKKEMENHDATGTAAIEMAMGKLIGAHSSLDIEAPYSCGAVVR